MEYEKLYKTVAEYTASEGVGNVTSVTPGVAYIEESDRSMFNNTYDTLTITYKIDDISSPTKIYNDGGVKTNLKEVFIDKNKVPVSSLTTTYQFENVGLHTIRYRYSGLSRIPSNAFSGCDKIAYIKVPESVSVISGEAFYNVKNIKTLDLKNCNKLTTIGEQTFQLTNNLTNVILPNSISYIGYQCFCPQGVTDYVNAKRKYYIILAETPPTKGDLAFSAYIKGAWRVSYSNIYVPYSEDHSILNEYKTAWTTEASRIFELTPNGEIPN